MQNDSRAKVKNMCSCNKLKVISHRNEIINRYLIMQECFPKNAEEKWSALPCCEDYLISTWGKIVHLKSYQGKKRELVPSFKMNRYPFITISLNGKRVGFSLTKLVKLLFDSK